MFHESPGGRGRRRSVIQSNRQLGMNWFDWIGGAAVADEGENEEDGGEEVGGSSTAPPPPPPPPPPSPSTLLPSFWKESQCIRIECGGDQPAGIPPPSIIYYLAWIFPCFPLIYLYFGKGGGWDYLHLIYLFVCVCVCVFVWFEEGRMRIPSGV